MTVLHTSPVLPALDNPVPSGQKRLAAWLADPTPEPSMVPALDVASLQRKYGPESARAPRMQEGTFRAEMSMRVDQFERLRNDRVNQFVIGMNQRGWDLDTSRNIQVYPGVHPALDLATQKPVIGLREFVVRAWFRCRTPEPLRLDLPPELLKPLKVA